MRKLEARPTEARARLVQPGNWGPSALNRVCILALLWFFASPCTEAFAQADEPLDLPGQIGGRIARCWKAPRTGAAQIVEVTVRLTFPAPALSSASRVSPMCVPPRRVACAKKIVAGILAAIKDCTPLPFTPSLGAAIAGLMLAIRFRSLPVSDKGRTV